MQKYTSEHKQSIVSILSIDEKIFNKMYNVLYDEFGAEITTWNEDRLLTYIKMKLDERKRTHPKRDT